MALDASITAAVGILGVLVGRTVQYYVGRALERKKHFQDLRSGAYADFLTAVAKIAQARGGHAGARMALTEAKVRITVYGSAQVLEALAAFEQTDQILGSSETNRAFALLVHAIRADSEAGEVDVHHIHRILLDE